MRKSKIQNNVYQSIHWQKQFIRGKNPHIKYGNILTNVILEGLIILSTFKWENLTDLFTICMSTAIMKWLRKYEDYIGKFKKAGLIWMDE